MPNLATLRPLTELPPKTTFPRPSHTRTVSPCPHPLPGSGSTRGPRGAGARWGPQWGGRAASMAAVAAVRRQPPVPARPARQGGQAGQAARWVTTAAADAAAGGGEKRRRGSARGTRGKGKAGGRGRGWLTLAPPAPPRAATRPGGHQRPAPSLEARPGPRCRPELGSPHLPWQQSCHWPLLPTAQPITVQGSCC